MEEWWEEIEGNVNLNVNFSLKFSRLSSPIRFLIHFHCIHALVVKWHKMCYLPSRKWKRWTHQQTSLMAKPLSSRRKFMTENLHSSHCSTYIESSTWHRSNSFSSSLCFKSKVFFFIFSKHSTAVCKHPPVLLLDMTKRRIIQHKNS